MSLRLERGLLCILVMVLGLLVVPATTTAEPAAGSQPSSLLVLGPLPAPMGTTGSGPLAPKEDFVPEINPGTTDPAPGDQVVLDPRGAASWREVHPGAGHPISLPKVGIYWIAVRPAVDRWTRLEIELEGGDSRVLYFDGRLLAGPEKGAAGKLEGKAGAARGRHLVLARVERLADAGQAPQVSISIASDPQTTIRWASPGVAAPTRFDDMKRVVSVGPVAVGHEGRLIARRLSFREPDGRGRHSRLDILGADGKVVAASVGDGTAFPIAFTTNTKTNLLLIREKGKHGTDLLLFDPDNGTIKTVARDLPELGFVRWGPGGTHLLLSSSLGVKKSPRDPKAAHQERALREKLSDYRTAPHLWLLEVATGARRELTAPGDWVLDDAAFVPAKRSIVYARTVPTKDRPWFATEIRWIDLIEGKDTLVKTFVGGWESRPAQLAPSLDGAEVAFIGPPDQVGAGHPEHNVYNRAVWLLNVESKKLTKITSDRGPAYTLGRGDFLSWTHDGHGLLAGATDGSVTRLVRIDRAGDGWKADRLGTIAEAISGPVMSPDRTVVAYVASGRAVPPEIHTMEVKNGDEKVVERPNAGLAKVWRLSRPEKAPFAVAGGRYIDAWWYPPTVQVDRGKTPLIVYYYGGATPTTRRFNSTHQVLAANGYAVLVINPHGALGYGGKFADAHVNDWGPKAAADIQAGIDAFLGSHPEIDAKRIGIYGGSYGGFMTEYLVSHSDRFAAAVAMYGISDIAGYWGGGAWGYTYGDTALAGSFPWNAEKLFAEHSPLENADKIHTPLLLLHGEADHNVPVVQSKELYTALKLLGRPVELVLFPGEDHGIAGSWKNWVGHWTMMLDFFDRYLRGEPEAWNARWQR